MIEKPTIIITSVGRTGTQFFAKFFQNILDDATCLHEPDILKIGRGESILQQLKDSGFWNLLIRKSVSNWSLIELADQRLREKIDDKNAIKSFYAQRAHFITTKKGKIYVESNSGYYGLIDLCSQTFKNYRIIYIIRDGRDWVRSWMNWGFMYDKNWLLNKISHSWPTAEEVPSDSFASSWKDMKRFEKICWAWTTLNSYAIEKINYDKNAKIFLFEDIFKSHERYKNLEELVDFSISSCDYEALYLNTANGWLDQKIHKSIGDFPKWDQWSNEHKKTFDSICGKLMQDLGYS